MFEVSRLRSFNVVTSWGCRDGKSFSVVTGEVVSDPESDLPEKDTTRQSQNTHHRPTWNIDYKDRRNLERKEE